VILIDFNQVMLASLYVSMNEHQEVDENYLRSIFLNSIRYNRKKFSQEFGEIVICADGRNSWRRSVFPYYKAGRKEGREQSSLDWNELFRIINLIRTEMIETFPYKVIHIDNAEADDIIGTLCQEFGVELGDGKEKILILSGDKDFIQLQRFSNVKQYNPVMKMWVEGKDPYKYLIEHVLKGDTGDGVPNILSPDNCLVIGQRQKPMTAKRLEEYSKGPSVMDEETRLRFERNSTLIDLSKIPEELRKEILEKYNEPKTIGRSKLFNFFVEKKLKNLLTDIGQF
jgi:5'-3' exonuclease